MTPPPDRCRRCVIVPGIIVLAALFGVFFLARTILAENVSVVSNLSVGTAIPSVTSVAISPAPIVLTANATTSVSVTAIVSDNNGCSAITSGTTTIELYRTSLGASCAPDDLNCYTATAFTTSSTCTGGQTSINTTTTFDVYWFAQATDATSSFSSDSWEATVNFTSAGATSTGSSATTTLNTLTALAISTTSINYGTMNASSTTGNSTQLVIAGNAGNSSSSLLLSGTAMTDGANTIPTSSEHYATTTFTYGGSEQQLSDTQTTVAGAVMTSDVDPSRIVTPWTVGTNNLPATENGFSNVVWDNYLYVIGGDNNPSNVVYASINSDGSPGTWTTSPNHLPSALLFPLAAVWDGYIYEMGGCPNSTQPCTAPTSSVFYAPINSDGSPGTWTTSPNHLPSAGALFGGGVYDGYLYTIGGEVYEGGTTVTTSSVFYAPINSDHTPGTWTTSPNHLPSPLQGFGNVVYDGYLYAMGGQAATTGTGTTTVVYAPINSDHTPGTWTTSPNSLPSTMWWDPAAAYNGYLYILGGQVQTGGSFDTSTVLYTPINSDGSPGAWHESSSSLPVLHEADGQQGIAYNGYLYVIAGFTSTGLAHLASTTYASLDSRPTYWGLGVPASTASGTYTGTVTFTSSYTP